MNLKFEDGNFVIQTDPEQPKPPRKKKDLNNELLRQLKLYSLIGLAIILVLFCFDAEHGLLGKILHTTLIAAFGRVRIIVPFAIVIYAVLRYKASCRKFNVVGLVIAIVSLNVSLMVTIVSHDGGFLGRVVYYILVSLAGERITLLVSVLVFIIVFGKLIAWVKSSHVPESFFSVANESGYIKPLPINLKALTGRKRTIQDVLNSYRVNAAVVDEKKGLTIDRYQIELMPGTQIRSVEKYEYEITMALGVKSIVIHRELGKLFIDVPNDSTAIVSLKDEFKTNEFKKSGRLEIPIGKTVEGESKYTNIPDLLHMLIAGTTNSGKSTLLNAIILSLLNKNNPDELKFIMIDTKQVELMPYNGIPHLITDVVITQEKANQVVSNLLSEMNRRYTMITQAGCKTIQTYNKKVATKMPYIIVVIEELAQLMSVKTIKTNIESSLKQFAAVGRAAGIHLIITTQQPNQDVLTGQIKANIPSRIALKVKGELNSRMILDKQGAEKLIGKGDMLYSLDCGEPERLQGFYLDEQETLSLIDDIAGRRHADQRDTLTYNAEIEQKTSSFSADIEKTLSDVLDFADKNARFEKYFSEHYGSLTEDENVLDFGTYKKEFEVQVFKNNNTEKVVRAAIENNSISKTFIKKLLNCGDGKANTILRELEELNFITTENPREILISLKELEQYIESKKAI